MIDASGSLSTLLDSLRNAVAKSSTLQTATHLSETLLKDDCVGRIFYDQQILEDLVEEGTLLYDLRPFVLITEQSVTLTADGYGPVVRSLPNSQLAMLIQDNALRPASQIRRDIQDSKVTFSNLVGGIMDDLSDINGQDDGFMFQTMQLEEPPVRTMRSKQTPQNDFFEAVITFTCGVSA